jgi:hypothetical protein
MGFTMAEKKKRAAQYAYRALIGGKSRKERVYQPYYGPETIEQKNYAAVRKVVRYFRCEGEVGAAALQAVYDAYNPFQDLFPIQGLNDIVFCPHEDALSDHILFSHGADHNNSGIFIKFQNLFQCGNAVHYGHGDIHGHQVNVGMQSFVFFEPLSAIGGGVGKFKVFGSKYLPQLFGDKHRIINNQNFVVGPIIFEALRRFFIDAGHITLCNHAARSSMFSYFMTTRKARQAPIFEAFSAPKF